MKTKLSNILGVSLALVLVFTMAFALMPSNKAEAQLSTSPNQWQAQAIPGAATWSLAAADVTGFVVANDGVTMYAVDNQTPAVLKSISAGAIWARIDGQLPAAFVAPARLIAIAPDNPEAIAIVDSAAGTATTAGGRVFISRNGGTSWAQLVANTLTTTSTNGTSNVTAIAVGPTRAGCILDRDYAVAIADGDAGRTSGGDIQFCGFSTTWTSCATQAVFATDGLDFTSVVFTPGFVGDRCLVAVGSDNAGGPLGGDTGLYVIQTSDVAPLAAALAPYPVVLDTSVADSPRDLDGIGATAACIINSSIALPMDYDPTAPPSGFRTFVGWTSVNGPLNMVDGSDDVYRVDFQTVRKLQTSAASGIWSIAYYGTRTSGTMMAGEAGTTLTNTTMVWASTDPQLAQPTWAGSAKAPTGQFNCVVVLTSPDLCYAGTTGVESALSVSNNGGASFNQRSLINTMITGIQDVMPTPDGQFIFMATCDNGTATVTGSGSNDESLWKSATPVTSYGWERIRISPNGIDWGNAVGDAIVRLSPEYLDDFTLFWCDRGIAGVGTAIQRSVDGGDIFTNRTAPATFWDIAVENSSIVYLSDNAAGNVYTSTSGAWTFDLPVSTAMPPFGNLAMCPTYPEMPEPGNLLGGAVAAGMVGLSLDANSSWIPLLPAVPGGGAEQVLAHSDWANRMIVYAGDSTAGTGIYRYEFGVSNAWELIRAATSGLGMSGLAMAGGTLYGTDNNVAERQLYPTLGVADMAGLGWDAMAVGAAARLFNAGPSALRAVVYDSEVNVWTIDTTGTNVGAAGACGTLMAYDDTMAVAMITPTIPATVAYDPNTGFNAPFSITWPQFSNATIYDLTIFGDPGCTQLVTGAFIGTPAVVAAAPAVVIGGVLSPGKDYYLLIRAANQVPLDALRSRYDFANPTKFTIEIGVPIMAPGVGPVLTGPAPGATDVDAADVVFSWGAMLSATEYEFILATDSALTNTVAGTPAYVTTPSFGPVTLDYDTSYFYAVKVTQPSVSPQSIGTFTTTAVPVEKYTCQYCGLTFDTRAELDAHLAAVHAPTTPLYIWIVIAIGAILVIAVVWLIFTTRKA